MAITEMIVPGLRSWPAHDRRPDSNSDATGRTARWSCWGTTAYVTVTDPAALPAARRLVSRQFAAAERAASRLRPDAELHKLYRAGGRAITVSPLLADLVAAALVAAERTDGDVDPTVGAAMTAVHSSRSIWSGRSGRSTCRDESALPTCGSRPTAARRVPGWEQVELSGRRLRVPIGTTLDLSATAKAVACDRAAAQVRDRLDVGVLVGLGADAVSAGPATDDGWIVEIGDRAGSRRSLLNLPAGAAVTTSHFTAHTSAGQVADPELGTPGHLIDPHTGHAPTPVWRMASAIGFSGLEAASYTAAALVRGTSARAWLGQLWVPAQLITIYDDVITVGPWTSHLVAPDAEPHTSPSEPSLPAPRVANPRRTTH
jgi:thiamine biosynthesis lipoprotein